MERWPHPAPIVQSGQSGSARSCSSLALSQDGCLRVSPRNQLGPDLRCASESRSRAISDGILPCRAPAIGSLSWTIAWVWEPRSRRRANVACRLLRSRASGSLHLGRTWDGPAPGRSRNPRRRRGTRSTAFLPPRPQRDLRKRESPVERILASESSALRSAHQGPAQMGRPWLLPKHVAVAPEALDLVRGLATDLKRVANSMLDSLLQ